MAAGTYLFTYALPFRPDPNRNDDDTDDGSSSYYIVDMFKVTCADDQACVSLLSGLFSFRAVTEEMSLLNYFHYKYKDVVYSSYVYNVYDELSAFTCTRSDYSSDALFVSDFDNFDISDRQHSDQNSNDRVDSTRRYVCGRRLVHDANIRDIGDVDSSRDNDQSLNGNIEPESIDPHDRDRRDSDTDSNDQSDDVEPDRQFEDSENVDGVDRQDNNANRSNRFDYSETDPANDSGHYSYVNEIHFSGRTLQRNVLRS